MNCLMYTVYTEYTESSKEQMGVFGRKLHQDVAFVYRYTGGFCSKNAVSAYSTTTYGLVYRYTVYRCFNTLLAIPRERDQITVVKYGIHGIHSIQRVNHPNKHRALLPIFVYTRFVYLPTSRKTSVYKEQHD